MEILLNFHANSCVCFLFVVLAYGAFHISPRMRSDIEICRAGSNSEIFPDLRFHYVRWHNHLIMTFAENDITPQNGEFAPADQASAATPKDNEIHSGVGVLDKTVKILDALESGPSTLGQLVSATGLARPTAHRTAIALERHRFVLRDQHGRFVLGSRFAELAAAAGEDRLLTAAGPILQTLLDRTGNPRRSIAVRAIRECASPPSNAHPVCAIPFRWAPCCRWRRVPPHRSCSLGRIPTVCIRDCATRSSTPPSSHRCASADGRIRQ